MMMEPSEEYVKKHLDLADEYLADAQFLLQEDRLRSAIDRSYYAMFYAAQALLISKKLKPPVSHRGVISIFGREIVKGGLIEKKFSRMLSEAFKLRQKSTYEVYANFGRVGVKDLISNAELFLKEIKKVLEQN